ncbi:efflux RND transporter periplasmic adaptor subunit [Roseiconus nitratireducens]|uniref:Efflux RND transporter periplasmic adaptor subunit n=1 Tax=Roseiconus nitratireducens TaxID=2605748 RepID=A0A5M6CRW6_9BACT|nr:efflux RND transporter periplasmic adaptor subunit [Roseiconus nitratireducens]KAA5537947.1 efflux RND transporter periplasmic adaptor subunit [Roseiconus nitratireducens]
MPFDSIRSVQALVLLIAFPLVGGAQVPVRVGQVQTEPMQLRHAVTGSLRAIARGELAALEPGKLSELGPREGHSVKKGEVLARIDARRLEAQKRQSQAELEVAKAELAGAVASAERARVQFSRISQLMERNATSRQEFDQAEADTRIADANVESARREIDRLRESIALLDIRLSDTVVRAPYDATVVQRHVEPGDWMQAGEPLLTLVSSGPIEAWLDVPERYIESLAQYGDQVVVRSRATGEASEVLSTRRVADVNPRVRTIRFIVTLANESGLLTPGMSVDGWIAVTDTATRLSVPKDAVVRRGLESYVFRIKESGVERLPVEILFESNQRIAVTSTELRSGDQVVVEGNERLSPGQAVAITAGKALARSDANGH